MNTVSSPFTTPDRIFCGRVIATRREELVKLLVRYAKDLDGDIGGIFRAESVQLFLRAV